MTTIVLLVSREKYLRRVLTSLELLDCDQRETNILCIVDGSTELFVQTRNLVQSTKFATRLTVKSEAKGRLSVSDIDSRRARIASAHNQARKIINPKTKLVFSVEDDTIIPPRALKKLMLAASSNAAFGMVEGVELGRWGVEYVGGWRADDIYDIKELSSLEFKPLGSGIEAIDAGGLYCSLIRADLYMNHEFNSDNGLGPDVNMGIEFRQLGFQNFIHWDVHCKHLTRKGVAELEITPNDSAKIVTLTHIKDNKWKTSY